MGGKGKDSHLLMFHKCKCLTKKKIACLGEERSSRQLRGVAMGWVYFDK